MTIRQYNFFWYGNRIVTKTKRNKNVENDWAEIYKKKWTKRMNGKRYEHKWVPVPFGLCTFQIVHRNGWRASTTIHHFEWHKRIKWTVSSERLRAYLFLVAKLLYVWFAVIYVYRSIFPRETKKKCLSLFTTVYFSTFSSCWLQMFNIIDIFTSNLVSFVELNAPKVFSTCLFCNNFHWADVVNESICV